VLLTADHRQSRDLLVTEPSHP